MTVAQALARANRDLADISGGRLDAEILLAFVTGRDRSWVLAHDDHELPKCQADRFTELIAARSRHVPVVHLTGTREFYGLDIAITPDVLTPRVETEQMVDWAIKYAPKNSRLVDIGTGSGAIAITIAKHRPDLQVTATDLSERELAVARRNAGKHDVTIDFIISDLWSQIPRSDLEPTTEAATQKAGTFQTIVTNLPYLTDDADLMPEVKKEPAAALFGGPDGLSLYKRFIQDLPNHLTPGGFLFTESDPWQHEALIAEAAKYHLSPIEQGYFILGFQRDK